MDNTLQIKNHKKLWSHITTVRANNSCGQKLYNSGTFFTFYSNNNMKKKFSHELFYCSFFSVKVGFHDIGQKVVFLLQFSLFFLFSCIVSVTLCSEKHFSTDVFCIIIPPTHLFELLCSLVQFEMGIFALACTRYQPISNFSF